MRLLVFSDLHLDIWRGHHPKTDLELCKPDVVILAGDIHGNHKAVAWANETFNGTPTMYVHGNHEPYGHKVKSTQERIADACDLSDTVFFLNCKTIILHGVRFIGATLWTDFCLFGTHTKELAMEEAQQFMNDYRAITVHEKNYYRKLNVSDTAKFHAEQRAYLESKIEEPFDGKTVVITHMAPSLKSVPFRFRTDLTSAAYASNLDKIAHGANLWIHGHTHDSFDYHIGDCRVVCNPCGYPRASGMPENSQFNPNLIIEI